MNFGGLRVIPYKPRHLRALRPRAYERGFLVHMGDLEAYGRALAVPDLSFSGLSGEVLDTALAGGFHRLQTSIPVDFEQRHAWARRLSFKEEGLMRKYGPDRRDFIRYGRTN